MKRLFLIFLLLIILLTATACQGYKKTAVPRIELVYTTMPDDDITIPLRKDHTFSEAPISIEEVEDGYNIIIHCVKGE